MKPPGGGELSHCAVMETVARRVSGLAGHVMPGEPRERERGIARVPTSAVSSPTTGAGLIRLGSDVSRALAEGRPVVALESTIVSHGMPYPENLAMARSVEEVVRSAGAVPATIAIIDGVPSVGRAKENHVSERAPS